MPLTCSHGLGVYNTRNNMFQCCTHTTAFSDGTAGVIAWVETEGELRWRLIWHMIMEQSFRMIVSVITENSSLVTICTLTISSTGMHRCLCTRHASHARGCPVSHEMMVTPYRRFLSDVPSETYTNETSVYLAQYHWAKKIIAFKPPNTIVLYISDMRILHMYIYYIFMWQQLEYVDKTC